MFDFKVVYVVVSHSSTSCQNESVSSEAYANIEDAVKFIEGRSDKPSNIAGWRWESETGVYKIKELKLV